jgi:hypothetical protein
MIRANKLLQKHDDLCASLFAIFVEFVCVVHATTLTSKKWQSQREIATLRPGNSMVEVQVGGKKIRAIRGESCGRNV